MHDLWDGERRQILNKPKKYEVIPCSTKYARPALKPKKNPKYRLLS